MTSNTSAGCQKYLDLLFGPEDPEGKGDTHLSSCAECREMRQVAQRIIGRKSLFPAPEAGLKGQILSRIRTVGSGETPNPSPFSWKNLLSFQFPFRVPLRFAAVAGIFLVFFALFSLTRPLPPLSKGIPWGETSKENPSSAAPLDQWLEISVPQAFSRLPDRTLLEISGPTTIQFHSRGFELRSGQVVSNVTPGRTTFLVKTPHGQIEVLGTVFSTRVTPVESKVLVISGKVRFTPLGGPPQTLVAGESGVMIPLPMTTSTETGIEVPSADGDVDQNRQR